jgi:(1->4)-alpha-D-glucan 1-alpha-D-glucosylmutase
VAGAQLVDRPSVTAVTRLSARLSETGWASTVLALPEGTWIDRLSGARWRGSVDAVDLFAGLPVALLARESADETSAAGEVRA